MATLNIYPQDLRQILIYVEALNEAEEKIVKVAGEYGIDPIQLAPITVTNSDGHILGYLDDEIGGAWSFTTDKPDFKIRGD